MDAVDECGGGESAEDDGVNGADAGAGEHGNGELGRHAHVDGDAVAFLDAEPFQDIGELLYFGMQLLIRERANFAGFALPDDGSFILAVRRNVAVETVIRKIDLAADEPLCPGTIPFENLVPLFEPVQFGGNARPELVGVVDRFLVELFVLGETFDVRMLRELSGRFELALLLQDGVDVGGSRVNKCFVGHDERTSAWRNDCACGPIGARNDCESILHSRRGITNESRPDGTFVRQEASMEQRVSIITLGVADLERSRAFYERLGWRQSMAKSEGIVFFQAGGMAVALYPREELAKDVNVSGEGGGFAGIALAYNARSREDVDAVMAEVEAAGAKLLKPAQEAFWGGYSGYFADPDGFLWEVAWNPFFPIAKDGAIQIPE